MTLKEYFEGLPTLQAQLKAYKYKIKTQITIYNLQAKGAAEEIEASTFDEFIEQTKDKIYNFNNIINLPLRTNGGEESYNIFWVSDDNNQVTIGMYIVSLLI